MAAQPGHSAFVRSAFATGAARTLLIPHGAKSRIKKREAI